MLLAFGLSALGLSYIGVMFIRRWAERYRVLDLPNERSSHTTPIPRGGGLAIVLVTLLGVGLAWSLYPEEEHLNIGGLLTGGVLVAGISGWDDLRPLPNWTRFAVHLLAAGIALLSIGPWQPIIWPYIVQLDLGWLSGLITCLWIVGLINAYNFMDGIDGLAACQAIVAGLGWAIMGWLADNTFISITGVVLAGSALGFLGHNWAPARIFMGDVGSAFLGYTFAVLTLVVSQTHTRFILAGAALVWPFIFDTVFTFLRRLIRREKVFSAHRSHLYQRLVIAGLSHRTVTLLYLALAGLSGILALAVVQVWPFADMIILIVLVCIGIILWGGVRWYEHHPLSVSSRPLSKL